MNFGNEVIMDSHGSIISYLDLTATVLKHRCFKDTANIFSGVEEMQYYCVCV
jgi:hypothetical protein